MSSVQYGLCKKNGLTRWLSYILIYCSVHCLLLHCRFHSYIIFIAAFRPSSKFITSTNISPVSSFIRKNKLRLLQQFDSQGTDCVEPQTSLMATSEDFPTSVAVVVDLENVRGYNGFLFTHDSIISFIKQWMLIELSRNPAIFGRHLFLVVDHGETPSSYWVPYDNKTVVCNGNNDSSIHGYAIVFSGSNCKADDSIVYDVLPYIYSSFNTTASINNVPTVQRCVIQIITADRLLIQRCHNVVKNYASGASFISAKPRTKKRCLLSSIVCDRSLHPNSIELEIVSPKIFLSQLENAHLAAGSILNGNGEEEEANHNESHEPVTPHFHGRDIVPRRRRHSGRSKVVYKKETTEDRIVLAEALRLKFEQATTSIQNQLQWNCSMNEVFPLPKSYVSFKNKNLYGSSQTETPLLRMVPLEMNGHLSNQKKYATFSIRKTHPVLLRLVVISDTHGFESQLKLPLPDGDVLLHLGDFATDTAIASKNMKKSAKSHHFRHDRNQLSLFDSWMAEQPHSLKIVVRGNHDPKSMSFVRSGATYVTQPTSMDIAGFTFVFVPYQSASRNGLRYKTLLPQIGCDVIVSHVPPYSILDRCYTGKLAGSTTLLKGAQAMNGHCGPPILWLCGHIHESRGVVRDVMLSKKMKDTFDVGTTVVNGACANLGRASHLEYGPVLLEISCVQNSDEKRIKKKVKVLHMDGQHEFLNTKHPYFFQRSTDKSVTCFQLLLAVDLGLRSGISLFDGSTGLLLRFEHFQFNTIDALEKGALNILHEWEKDANNQISLTDKSNVMGAVYEYKITHIAMEGCDPLLLGAWHHAIHSKNDDKDIRILLVTPDEWRADLLTRVERQSGESAKEASRRISQFIIHNKSKCHLLQPDHSEVCEQPSTLSVLGSGLDLQSSLSTDVAESILLGYHVLRRLGWCALIDPVDFTTS